MDEDSLETLPSPTRQVARTDSDLSEEGWIVVDDGAPMPTRVESFEVVRSPREQDATDITAIFTSNSIGQTQVEWPSQRYKYDSLAHGPWIRILRLEPGLSWHPIRCQLRRVLVSDAEGQYDALSYAWGEGDASYSIVVEGKIFKIRQNLHQCLRALRSTHRPVYLWADAICINQNNILEKGHQVEQMRRVYESARRTHLWLGEPSTAVLNLLQLAPLEYLASLLPWSTQVSDIVAGLDELLDNAYWSRLWIIQEVAVSREVQVHLGSIVIPWNEFVQKCEAALTHVSEDHRYSKAMNGKMSRNSLFRLNEQRATPTLRCISDLIKTFGQCLCMDPRDRVYGLLGLASDLKIEIDYSISRIRLFERVLYSCQSHCVGDLFQPLANALGIQNATNAQHAPNPPLRFKVPVEMHFCGKVGAAMKPPNRFEWGGSGFSLAICNYSDKQIESGDWLYALTRNSQAFNVHIQGQPGILVVERAPDQDTVEGTNEKVSEMYVNGVAGTAVAFDDIYMDHTKILNAMRTRKLFDGAIIRGKSPDQRVMTLQADVDDLLYVCRTLDL